MELILLIVLVLLLIGVLPVFPYSRTWGPAPSIGTLVLIIVLAIILL